MASIIFEQSNRTTESYSVALNLSPDPNTVPQKEMPLQGEPTFETKRELAPLELETDIKFRQSVRDDLKIND